MCSIPIQPFQKSFRSVEERYKKSNQMVKESEHFFYSEKCLKCEFLALKKDDSGRRG